MYHDHHLRFTCLLFLLCCLPSPLYALDSTLILTNQTSHAHLGLYAHILEDTTGKMSVVDVISPAADFQPLPNDFKKNKSLDMGLTQSTFWFHIKLTNQSDKVDWYFSHWGGLSRKIALYSSTNTINTATINAFVQAEPMQYTRSIQYHLHIPRGASQTLYISIQDKHTPLVLS